MKMPFAVIETHEKIFIWRLYVCKTLWWVLQKKYYGLHYGEKRHARIDFADETLAETVEERRI